MADGCLVDTTLPVDALQAEISLEIDTLPRGKWSISSLTIEMNTQFLHIID